MRKPCRYATPSENRPGSDFGRGSPREPVRRTTGFATRRGRLSPLTDGSPTMGESPVTSDRASGPEYCARRHSRAKYASGAALGGSPAPAPTAPVPGTCQVAPLCGIGAAWNKGVRTSTPSRGSSPSGAAGRGWCWLGWVIRVKSSRVESGADRGHACDRGGQGG